MKLLNSLLLCLMVHGIVSYKYYYKRIGNGFDIIYAAHEFEGYNELKSPKSLKVDHYDRGERPGVCNHGQFFCSVPYQRSATQHFECTLDYQCPRFFKCCQPMCFVHRVCQPAFGIEASSTLLPQPTITTDIWKTSTDIFSPATLTTHVEVISTDVTERTPTYFPTIEPLEPEPQSLNIEKFFTARKETSTEITSRVHFGTEQIETGELSKSTLMREEISSEISTEEHFEVNSPINIEEITSSKSTDTLSHETIQPEQNRTETESTPNIGIKTSTEISTVISTEEPFKSESTANIEMRTSSKTSETLTHELPEPEIKEELEISPPITRQQTFTDFTPTSTANIEITSMETRTQKISEISTQKPLEKESSSETKWRLSTEHNSRYSCKEPTNDTERETSSEKIKQITSNILSEIKSPTDTKLISSSETKKQTTAGIKTNKSRNRKTTLISIYNTSSESREHMTTSSTNISEHYSKNKLQRQEESTTQLTMTINLTNTSFETGVLPLSNNSAVQSTDITNSNNTSSYDTDISSEIYIPITTQLSSASSESPMEIKMNTSSVERNNLDTLEQVSDYDSSVNKTSGISQDKESIKTTEVVVVSEDYSISIDQTSDKNLVTETSFELENNLTGYIPKENVNIFGSDKEEHVAEIGQPTKVKFDEQTKFNNSYTGHDDRDENNMENLTKFPERDTGGVNKSEKPIEKVTEYEKHGPLSTEENNSRETSLYPTDDEDFVSASGELDSDGNGSGEGSGDDSGDGNGDNSAEFNIYVPANSENSTQLFSESKKNRPLATEENKSQGTSLYSMDDHDEDKVAFSTNVSADSEPKTASDTNGWVYTEHSSKDPTNDTDKEAPTANIEQSTLNTPSEFKLTENIRTSYSSETIKITTADIVTKPIPIALNNTSSESKKYMTTDSTAMKKHYRTDKHQKQTVSTSQSTMTIELTYTFFGSGIPSLSTNSAVKSIDITNTNNTASYDTEISSEISIPITTQLSSASSESPMDIKINSSSVERNNLDTLEQVSDYDESVNITSGISQEKEIIKTTTEVVVVSEDSSISTDQTSKKLLVTKTSFELENNSTGYIPKENASELNDNIVGSDKEEHVAEIGQPTEGKFDEQRKLNNSYTGHDYRFDENNAENLTKFPEGDTDGVNKFEKPAQKVTEYEQHRPLSTEANNSRGPSLYTTNDEELVSASGELESNGNGSGDVSDHGIGGGSNGVEFHTNVPANSENSTQLFSESKKNRTLATEENKSQGTSLYSMDDHDEDNLEFSTNVSANSESKTASETKGWVYTEHSSKDPTNDTDKETPTANIEQSTLNTRSEFKLPENIRTSYSSETIKITTADIVTKPIPIALNNTSSESKKYMTTDSTAMKEHYPTDKHQKQKESTTQSTMTIELTYTSFGSGIPSLSTNSAVKFIDITNTTNTSSYDTEISSEISIPITTQLSSASSKSPTDIKLNRSGISQENEIIKSTEVVVVSEDSSISTDRTSDKHLVTKTSFELENNSTGYIPKENPFKLNDNILGSDKEEHVAKIGQPTEVQIDEQRELNNSYTGHYDRFQENNVENPTKFPEGEKVTEYEQHRPFSTEANNSRGTSLYLTDDEDLVSASGKLDSDGNGSDDGSGGDSDDGIDGGSNGVEFQTNLPANSENSTQLFSESKKNRTLAIEENKSQGTSVYSMDDHDEDNVEFSANVPPDAQPQTISEIEI